MSYSLLEPVHSFIHSFYMCVLCVCLCMSVQVHMYTEVTVC